MKERIYWSDVARRGEAFHIQKEWRDRPLGVPLHDHDFAELFWIYGGRGLHRVNGREHGLKPGLLVFVRPVDRHILELISGESLGFVNVAFPLATLRFLRERYFPREKRWFWSREPLPETVLLEPARLGWLQEWGEALVEAPRTALEIDRFLLNVLHLTSTGVEGERLPAGAPEWLAAACVRIGEREFLQEGVSAWVRLAGRSPEHVSRVTRQWLGLSPTDYVNRLRLEFIERQLRNTARPVTEIAMEAGFSNLGHAYRLFKGRYGLPPLRHRRKHRKVLA